jgi:hypothetical protein
VIVFAAIIFWREKGNGSKAEKITVEGPLL